MDQGVRIARLLGFALVRGKAHECNRGRIRKIRGCLPGEAVYVNGIVIGTATGGEVVLRRSARAGRSAVRDHGKGPRARKGHEERTGGSCFSVVQERNGAWDTPFAYREGQAGRKVIFVDHCGHEVYRHLSDRVCGMVTVGDDTTAVCAHIGAHLGIPVLGIIDGDADSIVPAAFAPGSVLAHTVGERDDDVGKEVGMADGLPGRWNGPVSGMGYWPAWGTGCG